MPQTVFKGEGTLIRDPAAASGFRKRRRSEWGDEVIPAVLEKVDGLQTGNQAPTSSWKHRREEGAAIPPDSRPSWHITQGSDLSLELLEERALLPEKEQWPVGRNNSISVFIHRLWFVIEHPKELLMKGLEVNHRFGGYHQCIQGGSCESRVSSLPSIHPVAHV